MKNEWNTPSAKWHVGIVLLVSVLAVVSLPTFFYALVLIPLSFALPLAFKKPMLLVAVAAIHFIGGLVVAAMLGDVVFLLGIIAFLGAVGVAAGVIIRYARTFNARRKEIIRLVGILVVFVPVLLFVEIIGGFMRRPLATWQVHRHVARYYAHLNVSIRFRNFHEAFQNFQFYIEGRTNPHIRFTITREGRRISSAFSPAIIWSSTLDAQLTPLLTNAFGQKFRLLSLTMHGIPAGVPMTPIELPLDPTAPRLDMTARIHLNSYDPTAEALAARIHAVHQVLTVQGVHFTQYEFSFWYPDAARPVRIHLTPAQLTYDLTPLAAIIAQVVLSE